MLRFYQKYVVTVVLCFCSMGLFGSRCVLRRFSIRYIIDLEKDCNCTSPDRCPASVAMNRSTVIYPNIIWSRSESNLYELAFHVGYMLAQLPSGILCDMYGSKYILAIGTIGSAITCATMPSLLVKGSWFGCAIHHAIHGLFQGICTPALGSLISHWAPQSQTSVLVCIGLGAGSLGYMLCPILTSFFIHYVHHWRGIFIFWGTSLGIASVILLGTVYSSPVSHPFVSFEEKRALIKEFGTGMPRRIPWKSILTDSSTWAFFSGQTGYIFMTFTIESSIHVYFKEIVGLDIDKHPVYLVMPFLFRCISVVVLGFLADYLIRKKIAPVFYVRTICTGIGNIFSSLFLLFATFSGCNKTLTICCFNAALIMNAAIYPGLIANVLDRTRHYVGVITAIKNGLPALTAPLSAVIVDTIYAHHTATEWGKVYWFSFGVACFTTMAYLLRTSSERARWDVIQTGEPIRKFWNRK